MTLEYRTDASGKHIPTLTECPLCGYEFKSKRSAMARDGTRFGSDRPRHFYDDHTPEDFGLDSHPDDLDLSETEERGVRV